MRPTTWLCFVVVFISATTYTSGFDLGFLENIFGLANRKDNRDDDESTEYYSTEDDDDDDDEYDSDDTYSDETETRSRDRDNSYERRNGRGRSRGSWNNGRGSWNNRRSGRVSRFGSAWGLGGGSSHRNRFYGGRVESTRNEDIFDGLSGPRRTGESCLSQAKFRDGKSLEIKYTPRDVKRLLRTCDRHTNHYVVDIEPKRYGRYKGGCVYRHSDRKHNFWDHDPNTFNYVYLRSAEKRSSMSERRLDEYRCGHRKILRNRIKVAFEQQWCHQLYHQVRTKNCNYCRLKVMMEEREKRELWKCVKDNLNRGKSAVYVVHWTNNCRDQLAKEVDRC